MSPQNMTFKKSLILELMQRIAPAVVSSDFVMQPVLFIVYWIWGTKVVLRISQGLVTHLRP